MSLTALPAPVCANGGAGGVPAAPAGGGAAVAAEPAAVRRRSAVTVALCAGATTGGIETLVTYPTEYVKTHMQLTQPGRGQGRRGMWGVARHTVTQHGALGLYRGMSTVLAGAIPKQGVRWAAFEAAQSRLADSQGRLDAPRRAACGFLAGTAEALIAVTPAETVKTAFIEDQRGARRFRGLFHGVATLLREQGVHGVYRGAAATVLKQGTNQAVRFPAQYYALGLITGTAEQRRSPLRNGVAGFIAGCVSVLVTQPFDVVKTRMQAVDGAGHRGTVACARHVAHQGLGTVYAGTVPRMVRVGANVALTFSLFPYVKRAFQ